MNKLAKIIYNFLLREFEPSDYASVVLYERMANELAEIITEYIQIEINHALKTKEKQ